MFGKMFYALKHFQTNSEFVIDQFLIQNLPFLAHSKTLTLVAFTTCFERNRF